MTQRLNELIGDPVFQLNSVLWLAQPLPDGWYVRPVLHRCGFTVYAIAPPLPVPLDLQLVAKGASIEIQASVSPDVLLHHEGDNRFVFAECKKSSFSPTSDTSHQARSLLVVAGPRAAEVLGLRTDQVSASLLSYFVPDDQRTGLTETLIQLYNELLHNELLPATFSVLGLKAEDTYVDLQVDGPAAGFFGVEAGSHTFITVDSDNDPRFLYLIPYDPDAHTSDNEQLACKRILFERMQSTVIAAAGKAKPPSEISLDADLILNDATFGMLHFWQSRGARRHLRELCRQLMEALAQSVNSAVPDSMTTEPGKQWRLSLPNQKHQDQVIDALTRLYCERLDLKGKPHPSLFEIDDFEN